MSTPFRAIARPLAPGDRRLAALAATPIILAVLAVGVASADLPPGVVRLSAADAEAAGSTIRLLQQPVGGSTLVQVEPEAPGLTLLAISPNGTSAALADQVGELSGTLTVTADGAQLRIPLPGLLAATFSADGSWLAVTDGRGALWRVDAGSGRADLLAEGPFIGSPMVNDNGSLVLLAVPSVEAPYRSRLVRLEPTTGSATPLSDEELVYAAFPLDGGDLAIVAHQPQGTMVKRLTSAGERLLANLGPGAVNVAVARNGRIAFERDGEGVFVLEAPGAPPRSVGIGTRPCFAPDGSALLVRRGNQRLALGVDGSVLLAVDALAIFAGSEGCLP
jgi:hypothetical protein